MLFIQLHDKFTGAMLLINFSLVESMREHENGGTVIGMMGHTVYNVAETCGQILGRVNAVSPMQVYEVQTDTSEAN